MSELHSDGFWTCALDDSELEFNFELLGYRPIMRCIAKQIKNSDEPSINNMLIYDASSFGHVYYVYVCTLFVWMDSDKPHPENKTSADKSLEERLDSIPYGKQMIHKMLCDIFLLVRI